MVAKVNPIFVEQSPALSERKCSGMDIHNTNLIRYTESCGFQIQILVSSFLFYGFDVFGLGLNVCLEYFIYSTYWLTFKINRLLAYLLTYLLPTYLECSLILYYTMYLNLFLAEYCQ